MELVEFRFAVRARSHGDRPIRVQVVDMIVGNERMQRRVDGGGNGVIGERAGRIERHHLVLMLFAAIHVLERLEFVEVEHRETTVFDAAEVAAGAFYGHDASGFAGHGVNGIVLGTGVATAEIRNTQVGAERVGAISEKS